MLDKLKALTMTIAVGVLPALLLIMPVSAENRVTADPAGFAGTINATGTNYESWAIDVDGTPMYICNDGTGFFIASDSACTTAATLEAGELDIDQLHIDGHTITPDAVNGDIDIDASASGTGDINLTTSGMGEVNIDDVDIAGGQANDLVIGNVTPQAADFTSIGVTSPGTGSFSDLTSSAILESNQLIVNGEQRMNYLTSPGASNSTIMYWYADNGGASQWATMQQVQHATVPHFDITQTFANGDINLITSGTGLVNSSNLQVDNLNLNGNTLSSTSGKVIIAPLSGQDLELTPAGAGNVNITANSLEMAGTTRINAAGEGILTNLDVDNINIDGNTLSSTDTNGGIILRTNAAGQIHAYGNGVKLYTNGGLQSLDVIGATTSNSQIRVYNASNTAYGILSASSTSLRLLNSLGTQYLDMLNAGGFNMVSANNQDIGLTPSGTGNVNIAANGINIGGNPFVNSDRNLTIGDTITYTAPLTFNNGVSDRVAFDNSGAITNISPVGSSYLYLNAAFNKDSEIYGKEAVYYRYTFGYDASEDHVHLKNYTSGDYIRMPDTGGWAFNDGSSDVVTIAATGITTAPIQATLEDISSSGDITAGKTQIMVDTSGGAVDIDLPDAATYEGMEIRITLGKAGNDLTVTCQTGTDRIVAAATAHTTATFNAAMENMVCYAAVDPDGNAYWIVSYYFGGVFT